MNHKPVAIGLLLCEQVIFEEHTRNVTPVNCFTKREVEGFPSDPFPFVVFAALLDGMGDIRFEVSVQRLDTFEEVYKREFGAQFTDPLREVRFVFRCRDCRFPIPGEYQVSILADGEVIAQRKLRIYQKEEAE
jgi:hypothetical protein